MKNLIKKILIESTNDERLLRFVEKLENKFGKNFILNYRYDKKLDELGVDDDEKYEMKNLVRKRNLIDFENTYGKDVKIYIDNQIKNGLLNNEHPPVIIKKINNELDNIGYQKEVQDYIRDSVKKIEKELIKNDYESKIDEYVKKYSNNPKLGKKTFLIDVISKINTPSIRKEVYNEFLNKLSLVSGQKIEKKSSPEQSGILLKLANFIQSDSEKPKSRGEFLKNLGVPRAHYSTTFSRLMRNGLIQISKKDGKKVYELGPNFDKFIEGEKFEVDNLNKLFHSYIEEKFDSNKFRYDGTKHRNEIYWDFYSDYGKNFYKDSERQKFMKSFLKILKSYFEYL